MSNLPMPVCAWLRAGRCFSQLEMEGEIASGNDLADYTPVTVLPGHAPTREMWIDVIDGEFVTRAGRDARVQMGHPPETFQPVYVIRREVRE